MKSGKRERLETMARPSNDVFGILVFRENRMGSVVGKKLSLQGGLMGWICIQQSQFEAARRWLAETEVADPRLVIATRNWTLPSSVHKEQRSVARSHGGFVEVHLREDWEGLVEPWQVPLAKLFDAVL